MATTALDHLVAFVLVIVVPVYVGAVAWPRVRSRLASQGPDVRVRLYWTNVALHWTLTAATVAVWLGQRRGLAGLGLERGVGGWRLWLAGAAAAVVALAVIGQYAFLVRSGQGRATLREALRESAPFVPRNRRELGHFAVVGVTAGMCEEILYRGFLIWYVCQFVGTGWLGLGLSIVITSVVFAFCHLYQGPVSAVRIGALAIVFGSLYVLSQTLWVVIVLHAVLDIAGGAVAVAVRDRGPRAEGG